VIPTLIGISFEPSVNFAVELKETLTSALDFTLKPTLDGLPNDLFVELQVICKAFAGHELKGSTLKEFEVEVIEALKLIDRVFWAAIEPELNTTAEITPRIKGAL